MENLIVVDDPAAWPLDIPGTTVASARRYLIDPDYRNNDGLQVINLCKCRYQSLGYYASLLADARGQKPMPSANTVKDLLSGNLVRYLIEQQSASIQRLAPLSGPSLDLQIYFGRTFAKPHDEIGSELFDILRVPLMHARFEYHDAHWHLRRVQPLAAADVPREHRDFVVRAARDYLTRTWRPGPRTASPRYRLAILHDPHNPEQASNPGALRKFEQAADALDIRTERITAADFARLPEFDALFIRGTTFADHYTYRFARRAAAAGLAVIDDPESILKCNNKVYVAELLEHHRIPVPKTLLVHRGNRSRIIPELGLPCVLKRPDSAFSQGVVKVESAAELATRVGMLLDKSELIIAQEYLPTAFDWRIGILDRQPIFAAKYFMVPGHWQIIKHGARAGEFIEGNTQAVALREVPEAVCRLALRAANLIGDGLYGIDLKQAGERLVVIEINDNPNIDAGNEDAILGDALYRTVLRSFVARMAAHRPEDAS